MKTKRNCFICNKLADMPPARLTCSKKCRIAYSKHIIQEIRAVEATMKGATK